MDKLTTLAPDIVAAILGETLLPEVTLFDLAAGTPLLWEGQRRRVDGNPGVRHAVPISCVRSTIRRVTSA
jgi:hypothetical protein